MFNKRAQPFPNRRASDQSTLIEMQLAVLAYQNLPAMLGVNIAATLGVVFLLYSDGVNYLISWLSLVLILSGLRLLSWFCFQRYSANDNRDHSKVSYWGFLYIVGLQSAALIWVALVFITFQLATSEAKFSVIVIISALAGGATGITAPFKYAGRIYITILLLVTSIIIYWVASEHWVLSLLGVVFWVAMVISHRNNHYVLLKSLTLQLENKNLINNLQHLNAELEQRVQQRTSALERIAHNDALTGLPNRLGLQDWMQKNLRADNPQEAAILFLDLDRFKQINDALGHEVGDQVLCLIAQRFNDICPDDAILARWGGDEFLLVTAQADDTRERAETLARQLIDAAIAPLCIRDQTLGVGLSVGMAYYPRDAINFQDIIHAADLTVAEVKRSGRGNSLIYNDMYAHTQKRRFDLGRALSDAIKQNELTLAYQPIINALTNKVETLEALSRWRHPTLGVIDPSEFIRLAEETDRIVALGDWVLHQSCSEARKWRKQHPNVKLAVNVSIKQLLTPNFSGRVISILKQTEFPPSALILEVTESLFSEAHLEMTLATVTQLRDCGIGIYIDDFGTGYSSLSRLHEFPVTGIKIDRSFTAQMKNQGVIIIESAMFIAKRMDLIVVVEGVESVEQFDQLRALGVVSMQGFYLGRPTSEPGDFLAKE